VVIFGDNDLRILSPKFLCQLLRQSKDIAGRRFDRYSIFEGSGIGVISAEGVHQATDEIVQHLFRQSLINTYEDNNDVSLTFSGLDEAQRTCR
jgi:hypothetical protein